MDKVKLSDVCECKSSNLKQSDIENSTGEFPVYGASGYIKDVDFYEQEKECLAIVKDGAGVGRIFIVPAKSSILGTMQYLISKSNILVKYLYYCLRNLNFQKYKTGATIPHIYFKSYCNEKVTMYDIPVQQKIVEELDCLSNIIEKKKKQLSDFDELIKSKFVEMFGHYNKKELRDFVTFFSGYAFKSRLFQDHGIPIIRISNIQNGEIDLNVVYYPESEVAGLEKYKLQFNDILIAMSGATTGKVGLFKEKHNFLLNQRVGCIRPITEKATSCFLFAFLNSEMIQTEILKVSTGCAQPNISGTQILSIQIPDVPLNEQIAFNDFVQLVDESKDKVRQSLEETQNLFNERMQHYFGE